MNLTDFHLPVLGFSAFSGSGKTTLLEKLIPLLRKRGLDLALIKHSHHDFEIDKPGKDSDRLRKAGAEQVILASAHRTVWIREGDGHSEPRLAELLAHLDASNLDLVLVEGFRHEPIPKLEIHRPSMGTPLLCTQDAFIIAVATDIHVALPEGIVHLPLNVPQAVANFVFEWWQEQREQA